MCPGRKNRLKMRSSLHNNQAPGTPRESRGESDASVCSDHDLIRVAIQECHSPKDSADGHMRQGHSKMIYCDYHVPSAPNLYFAFAFLCRCFCYGGLRRAAAGRTKHCRHPAHPQRPWLTLRRRNSGCRPDPLITGTQALSQLRVWIPPEIGARTQASAEVLSRQIQAFNTRYPELEIVVERKTIDGAGWHSQLSSHRATGGARAFCRT